jgi:HD-like signal output (HDOD) protein
LLFVDDDQHVLDGLVGSLWRMRKQWDLSFVCGGGAAIDALRTSAFDVVVSDMRMAPIDGEAVLRAARELRPGAIRIVLSGQTDRDATMRTTSIAHEFLSKPCAPAELRGTIERLLAIAQPLSEEVRALVFGLGELPITTASRACLDQMLAQPSLERAAVVACIEADIGLTAKLVHVAGAGFFARRRVVTNVAEALDILGSDATRTFLAARHAEDPAVETRSLYAHSLATAQAMAARSDDPGAYMCGVLHGLGKLAMLWRFGAAYAELLAQRSADPGCELHDLEHVRFGARHDLIAAYLVELWGFPAAIAGAIRGHCAPAEGDGPLAFVLHDACGETRRLHAHH